MPTSAPELLKIIWNHPANRGQRVRSVTRAALWQGYKRTIRRPITIDGPGDFKVRCYPDNEDSGSYLYLNGLSDFDALSFLRRYLRPKDSFLDGGAHTGIYTLLEASVVGPTGQVDAFEAAPRALWLLAENVALNGFGDRVSIHATALADARSGCASSSTAAPVPATGYRRRMTRPTPPSTSLR